MKLQAHIPTASIGARDWRAAKIALISLAGVSVLLLAWKAGASLDNLLLERLRMSSVEHREISVAHRVSLDLHLLSHRTDQWRRFSVAHALPANVALSQPYSIGIDERDAFEVFGETALRDLVAEGRTDRQLELRNDRALLMLMLLRLRPHRH
jgi:hypothetical protein